MTSGSSQEGRAALSLVVTASSCSPQLVAYVVPKELRYNKWKISAHLPESGGIMKRIGLLFGVALLVIMLGAPVAGAGPKSVTGGTGGWGEVTYLGAPVSFRDNINAISATYQSGVTPIQYWGNLTLGSWYQPATGVYYPGYGYVSQAYVLLSPASTVVINGKPITMQQLGGSRYLGLWLNDSDSACTITWRSCDFKWITVKRFDGKRYSVVQPEYEVQSIIVDAPLVGTAGAIPQLAAAELASL